MGGSGSEPGAEVRREDSMSRGASGREAEVVGGVGPRLRPRREAALMSRDSSAEASTASWNYSPRRAPRWNRKQGAPWGVGSGMGWEGSVQGQGENGSPGDGVGG